MKKYFRILKEKTRSEFLRDSMTLYIGESLHILLALLISLVRPKFLGPEQAGLISYVNSYIITTAAFFSLGYDISGARLIISSKSEQERNNNISITLTAGLIFSALFSVFILGLSSIVPIFGNQEAGSLMLYIFPFASYSIINLFIRQCSYSTGKMKKAAWLSTGYYIIYLPIIYLLNYFDVYDAKNAIISEYSISFFVSLVAISTWIKIIKPTKETWKILNNENKKYGLKVYIGRIISMPTFNLDTMILGMTQPLAFVSYYTISNSMTRPIVSIGQSIAQSLFRKMGESKELPRKLIYITLSIMLGMSGLIWIVGRWLVENVLGEQFYYVTKIVPFMIIIAIFRGITSIYHYFLSAKGMGDALRICAIIMGVTSLILNLTLIPLFGVEGAIFASLLSIVFNFIAHFYYYLSYQKYPSKFA